MAGTFYYTTLRHIWPWYDLPKFIITMLFGILIIYALEHKFGVKSLWAYQARQMGIDGRGGIGRKGKEIVVAVSGGFDPLNGRGHLTHIQEAKKLGTKLIVILSRDDQLILKGNKPNGTFYPRASDRMAIIKELRSVDGVVMSIDKDGLCADSLELDRADIFAKGGDRNTKTMPIEEIKVCEEIGCRIIYQVGEAKRTSSSELIKKARGQSE